MTEKPGEAMRGRHRTVDPSGFQGFTASRKRTLKKLPTLAHIKTDVPLSAAALAAHEASFAKEDSEGLASRLSPRFMECKAGEEAQDEGRIRCRISDGVCRHGGRNQPGMAV